MNSLIREGQRAAITIRDVINNVVYDTFNTWFSSCYFSRDKVREADRLNIAIEENKIVYCAARRHAYDSNSADSLILDVVT